MVSVMALQATRPPATKETDDKVRSQLERMLNSNTFQHVDRLKRFLSFIVDETLLGRSDQLKELLVGIEVFGKESSFDPRTDPIVRVQARRLRTRLARYYREEGQDDEIVIDLPKGGYSPTFRVVEAPATKRPVSPTLVSRNTVVVLPFADHSPDASQGYFCKGLCQEIIHTLAKVGTMRIMGWDSPQPSESTADAREAADRLHAAIIVSGSVRKSNDDLRITSHLMDAVSGCYLWSDSITRKADDVFGTQEEIARHILQQLEAETGGKGSPKAARHATANLAAYNLYLQGRYHLNQRTETSLRKAVEFFERSLVEDARNAGAYSGLADAFGLLAHYGVVAPVEVWSKAASNAASAVLLGDHLAEAHTSLAHVRATQDWDWAGSETEYKRAIELDPRYATAHHWFGISCLAPLGRLDDALEEVLLAQALDPVSSIISRDLAMIYYYRRDYEAALEQCDQTIEMNPHFTPAYFTLSLVQEQRGDLDEAAAACQRAIQLSAENPRMLGALGRIFALSGKQNQTAAILATLEELSAKRYVSPFLSASICFAQNKLDEGFERLTKAFHDRSFDLLSIKIDPRFDQFRRDARLRALCARLGLG